MVNPRGAELLINAATHADVRTMTVGLGRSARRVLVTVEDHGRGFDTEDREAHGYGLFGIREQLHSVGGRMRLVPKPGEGASVTLSLAVGGSPRARARDFAGR
jgi:signal transduction histidine kinase